jgi:hypothetical protein
LLLPFVLFMAIISLVVVFSSNANANTPGSIEMSRPCFTDMNGDRLASLSAGEQVIVTTTHASKIEQDLTYVALIEIRDDNGLTVFLSWQVGELEAISNKTIGVSWVVPESSQYYQSRVFAITNFEEPHVLSVVEICEISVKTT